MSKKLTITSITNELEGSAFFPPKRQISPLPTPLVQDHQEEKVIPTYPVPPVRVVPLVPPVKKILPSSKKRVMKQRHPFDIYQDQYEALLQLAAEDRKKGGIGSMSAMVREALDKLIAEKRKP